MSPRYFERCNVSGIPVCEESRVFKISPPDPANDRLRMNYINSLPHPLIAPFAGGDEWFVQDIEVQTGYLRVDVCGRLQVNHISEVLYFRDNEDREHSTETFYTDYAAMSAESETNDHVKRHNNPDITS